MQVFRNKTKWKLQATKTWVTTFFAGTTLQKAKQQTNIWELLYDWLQGISREQVYVLELGESQFPYSKESTLKLHLLIPPYFPKLAFPHLYFLVKNLFSKGAMSMCLHWVRNILQVTEGREMHHWSNF